MSRVEVKKKRNRVTRGTRLLHPFYDHGEVRQCNIVPFGRHHPFSGLSVEQRIRHLSSLWRAHLSSAGSNNAILPSSLQHMVERMAHLKPFTRESVFIDFGSGCGLPCIYVASKYAIKTVGVEMCKELVVLARHYARLSGVDHLCHFYTKDVCSLSPSWIAQHQPTHCFSFDGVFPEKTWTRLFCGLLDHEETPAMLGCSVAKYSGKGCNGKKWPEEWKKYDDETFQAMTVGSRGSFLLTMWENKPKQEKTKKKRRKTTR